LSNDVGANFEGLGDGNGHVAGEYRVERVECQCLNP
jgi:hypothetical protein